MKKLIEIQNQKYFDRFFIDIINVEIYKNKLVKIQRILILEK